MTIQIIKDCWLGPAGKILTTEDNYANQAIGAGWAVVFVPTVEGPPLGYDRETGEIVTEEPAPAPAVGQPRDETSSASSEDDGPPKPPWSNRPKAEWVAYAVSQGHDPDEAAALPKADLMSLYGERL